MENINNSSIWSPQQEKVINNLSSDISKLSNDFAEFKKDVNQKFDKILKHLGIE